MALERVPYEHATSGNKAKLEIEDLLLNFGCTGFGSYENVEREEVLVQFVYRGQEVSVSASYRGWAETWLEANPWTSRKRISKADWRTRAIGQGRLAVWSVLRDQLKGHLTAVLCGINSTKHAFLPWMVTDDGRTVAERIDVEKMLPKPTQERP